MDVSSMSAVNKTLNLSNKHLQRNANTQYPLARGNISQSRSLKICQIPAAERWSVDTRLCKHYHVGCKSRFKRCLRSRQMMELFGGVNSCQILYCSRASQFISDAPHRLTRIFVSHHEAFIAWNMTPCDIMHCRGISDIVLCVTRPIICISDEWI